jgi:hypothetical protein
MVKLIQRHHQAQYRIFDSIPGSDARQTPEQPPAPNVEATHLFANPDQDRLL